MEANPIRVCELMVGLVDVDVLGVEDFGADVPLRLHIEDQGPRPTCEGCGFAAEFKVRPQVVLVDLCGVREAGADAVAQAPVALSQAGMWSGFVDWYRHPDRCSQAGAD